MHVLSMLHSDCLTVGILMVVHCFPTIDNTSFDWYVSGQSRQGKKHRTRMLQEKISAFCCSIFRKQKSCFIAIDFHSQGLCGYHHEGRQGGSKCPPCWWAFGLLSLLAPAADFLEKHRLFIQIRWIQGLRVLKMHHVFCCSTDSFPASFFWLQK